MGGPKGSLLPRASETMDSQRLEGVLADILLLLCYLLCDNMRNKYTIVCMSTLAHICLVAFYLLQLKLWLLAVVSSW